MNEPQQLLRDPSQKPTPEIISNALGKANTVYLQFLKDLNSRNITLMGWRYYNDGKAWLNKGEYHWTTSRGTSKVKPLFWLSIWDSFFKVSFFFSQKTQAGLLSLPISPEAKQIIQNAKSQGKTTRFISVIFDIKDTSQLQDVYALAEYRKSNI